MHNFISLLGLTFIYIAFYRKKLEEKMASFLDPGVLPFAKEAKELARRLRKEEDADCRAFIATSLTSLLNVPYHITTKIIASPPQEIKKYLEEIANESIEKLKIEEFREHLHDDFKLRRDQNSKEKI